MPISTTLRKLACCAARQEDEAEATARRARPGLALTEPGPAQAGLERAQVGPAPAGRPHRDFVEREAECFRREIENDGSLDEPGRQGAGAAALPEPPRAQRGSPGPQPGPALTREHMAVHAVQMHLVEKGLIKPPYSRLEASPDYVEALVQMADDAGWLARETPAPPPAPRHMSRAEAVIDLVLSVLQSSASALLQGGGDKGFGR